MGHSKKLESGRGIVFVGSILGVRVMYVSALVVL